MEYKKVKVQRWKDDSTKSLEERGLQFDYLEWEGKDAIFRAPDTPAGTTILDRRREREG